MTLNTIKKQYQEIDNYAPCKSLLTLPFTTTETISKRLKYLRDTLGLTYPQIAALSEFDGIPFGTLQWMYKTGKMAHIHKAKMRWRTSKPRDRFTISGKDPYSAAQSIKDHSNLQFIKKLVFSLSIYLYGQEKKGK